MQTVANSGRRTSNQASRWAAESAFLNSQLLDFRLERRRRNSKSGSSPARTCHQVALSHPLWLVVFPPNSAAELFSSSHGNEQREHLERSHENPPQQDRCS